MDYSTRPIHWKPLVLAAEKAHRLGDGAQAETLLKHAIAIAERALGRDHVNVAATFVLLGDLLFGQRRFAEAEIAYRQAAKIYQALGPDHEVLLVMAIRALAHAVKEQERLAESFDLMICGRQILFEYQGAGNDNDGGLSSDDQVVVDEGTVSVILDTGAGEPLAIKINAPAKNGRTELFDSTIDNKFSDEQIVSILQAAEAGADIAELCQKYRLPDDLFFEWKSLYSGLRLKDIRRLRQGQPGKCKG